MGTPTRTQLAAVLGAGMLLALLAWLHRWGARAGPIVSLQSVALAPNVPAPPAVAFLVIGDFGAGNADSE